MISFILFHYSSRFHRITSGLREEGEKRRKTHQFAFAGRSWLHAFVCVLLMSSIAVAYASPQPQSQTHIQLRCCGGRKTTRMQFNCKQNFRAEERSEYTKRAWLQTSLLFHATELETQSNGTVKATVKSDTRFQLNCFESLFVYIYI